jgi:hypothetical protein
VKNPTVRSFGSAPKPTHLSFRTFASIFFAMEKRLLFLIISFFGVAFSQDFQSWTGSTGFYNYPSLSAYPVQYNGSICAAGTNKTGYQSFTISVTAQNANRIWTIAAIVEKNHMGYAQIQVSFLKIYYFGHVF